MSDIYQDPVLVKYRDLIKANNKEIKTYYLGDPIRVPVSALPACILTKTETRVGNETNVEDVHEQLIKATIITDIRNDLNEDKQIVAGVNTLYNILEGREDTTYKLKTSALLHILRNNVSVDTAQNLRTDLDTVTRVDYGMTVGKRQLEAWSVEGEIEWVAHFIQNR